MGHMKRKIHILKSYSDEADLTLCGLTLFSYDGSIPKEWLKAFSRMFRRRKLCDMCKKRMNEDS